MRDELAATMRQATETLTSQAASSRKAVANTDAAAIRGFAEALGLSIPVEAVERLLVVLSVLVIELGGGTAFALAGSLNAAGVLCQNAKTECSDRPPAELAKMPAVASVSGSAPSVSDHPAKFVLPDATSERLMVLLRERGGQVFGGQRMLAKGLNTSPASLNRVLHELANAGRITVEAGANGTIIKLANVH